MYQIDSYTKLEKQILSPEVKYFFQRHVGGFITAPYFFSERTRNESSSEPYRYTIIY